MRRSSLVAPLLLIAVGALFLARNVYPDLPLLDYLAKYWPFLLIFWGLLRLGEVVFWAASDPGDGTTLPPRGISGGEWVLVIFLCIFGSSLHAVRGMNSWWPHNVTIGGLDMFGESYEFPISGEKPSSKTPHVILENFRGNARITGVDAESVKVTGHRTIRSLDQNGADKANQSAPFEVDGDSNTVNIRNNQDRLSGGNARITAEMEIMVPKGASIEAHGRYGDFDITDVNGLVDIVSDNAGVRLQNLGGDAHVDLRRSDVIRAVNVKGGVELRGHGADIDLANVDGEVSIDGVYSGVIQLRNLGKPLRFKGQTTELNIEKLPGQVRMALGDLTGSDLTGPIMLNTRSRDVHLSGFSNSIQISVDRGDIVLRPDKLPLARIDVQTRSGDIELALPPNGKFDLTASTSRGEVTNDFGAPLKTENDGRGASIRGSTGGGATATIHTDHGTIVVRKSSPSDKPFVTQGDDDEDKPMKPLPDKPLKKIEQ